MEYIGISEQFVVMFGGEQNEYSHSHYGIQLLIPTNRLEINGNMTNGLVFIDSNVQHLVYGDGKILSLIFNPESEIGQKIKQYYFKDKSIEYFYNLEISNAMKRIDNIITDIEAVKRLIIMILEQLVGDIELAEQLDKRVKDMINYIKFSDFEHLRYEDVINNVFLSKSRVTHLFKKEMRIPLMKYITWKRLINASKTLIISQKTITDTAYLYGFADSAHFSRVFKENFGISPSQIIQKKQKDSRLVHVFNMDFL
ncbi:helix-turn-helix transcriptional regulator [Proteiniborus sp. MB09-C3]|uniref:helix-turn-helix transcriptional regulator n=1 Tax=Proteiniborus sp. MB09-C3 TaxID=3050072 RepID=UPI002553853E|nr:helix-turn-helix transcriptional regulator [Proteiniborus sp. MB09-C3]WIV13699.1 helix-turn-helix transcriptional regulator [Proteiniborus sp. MB09-C3]